MFYFSEQYGGMQNSIQITNESLQKAFTQSGISIDEIVIISSQILSSMAVQIIQICKWKQNIF